MFSPENNVAVAHRGSTTTKSSKKKSDDRSIELIYAQVIQRNPDYAKQGGALYRWVKSHYQMMRPQDDDGEAIVLEWLSNNHPDKATPRISKECYKAACMLARPLPTKPEDYIVIPLRNAYLEIKKDGTIVRTPPDPALGITYVINAELSGTGNTYTPSEVPAGSLLDHYLNTSLPDMEVRNYLQELAGDTLIPTIREHIATVLKGSGNDGKSIYIKLLTALHEKTAAMQLDQLKGFALMPLLGCSLVTVSEVPKHGICEQIFKGLVAGDEMTIDMKHRDPILYRPKAKWIISTNNDQKFSDNSHGLWRRLAIIPFNQKISRSDMVRCLDERIIKEELLLFLDWCLIGLLRLLKRGKLAEPPKAVEAETQMALEASSSVASWFAEINPRATTEAATPKDTIYGHYAHWCDVQRLHALSGNQFWKALRAVLPAAGNESQLRKNGQRIRCVAVTLQEPSPEPQECPFDDETL